MVSDTLALVTLFLLMACGRYLWSYRSTPARLHVPRAGGRLFLRQPRSRGVMLGFAALLPALVLGAVGASAWMAGTGKAGLFAVAIATLLPLTTSLHQFLSAFLHRFAVHDIGIENIGVVTRRMVRWADVASVSYNPLHRWFFVTTSRGSHLWLPEDLYGIGDFAAVALHRLPSAALSRDPAAREELEELAAAVVPAAAAGEVQSCKRW
jgi:hypothetical protein